MYESIKINIYMNSPAQTQIYFPADKLTVKVKSKLNTQKLTKLQYKIKT